MIPDAKHLIFSDSTHLAFGEYLFEKAAASGSPEVAVFSSISKVFLKVSHMFDNPRMGLKFFPKIR